MVRLPEEGGLSPESLTPARLWLRRAVSADSTRKGDDPQTGPPTPDFPNHIGSCADRAAQRRRMGAAIHPDGERPALEVVAASVAPPKLAAMARAWKIYPPYGG